MQAERAEPLEPLAETEQHQPVKRCFMFEYETVENVTQLKRPGNVAQSFAIRSDHSILHNIRGGRSRGCWLMPFIRFLAVLKP